jgi:CPA1 family monovalent cation:H+ antiporter
MERIELLLLVAAIVAVLARRARLPYTVGLVVTGVILAFVPMAPRAPLSRELIFTAFLPPLIFEAALHMRWSALRRDLLVVLLLATLGVVLAAGLTTVGMHFVCRWGWAQALLLGVLISATDPVSVIATFREAGASGRLRLLVEAESLLNDGTAAVLFGVALTATTGEPMSPPGIAQTFLVMVVGGILCGAVVGAAVLVLAGRTTDHLIEITFTTVAAYGSFLLAERLGLSGVLAALTAGVLIGNVGPLGALSERGHEAVESFWEYAAFVANSFVFLLIGIQLTQENLLHGWFAVLTAIAVVLAGRAVSVYGCAVAFHWSAWRVPWRYQHVLFWGGLRGALALALALGLPSSTPHRDLIVAVAFGVVAFSVIVQGTTIVPLLRALDLREPGPKEVASGQPGPRTPL